MEKVVLLGAGGYCSGVIDSIRKSGAYEIAGITDPDKTGRFCNVPILGTDEVLKEVFESGVTCAHITVGSIAAPLLRKKLVAVAKAIGFRLVPILDPSAQVGSEVDLGEMVYIGKNAVVNSLVKIGDFCIINTGSIVEHGCVLGDWVHIAPGCALAGDITVGNSSHVGIGTTVLQGITIGEHVIIGAGSVVVRNVGSNKTVYGVVKE